MDDTSGEAKKFSYPNADRPLNGTPDNTTKAPRETVHISDALHRPDLAAKSEDLQPLHTYQISNG